jgi:large subunit ribosomal protein L33
MNLKQQVGHVTYYIRIFTEEKEMRTRITLACTECKQRNYNLTKDKKTHPDRMETKKYCRFCKAHTLHKETK